MIDDLWQRIVEFNDKYIPGWRKNKDLVYLSNALAGEVGEVCGATKKLSGGGTSKRKITPDELIEECFDVFVYFVMLLENMGVTRDLFRYHGLLKLQVLKERVTT